MKNSKVLFLFTIFYFVLMMININNTPQIEILLKGIILMILLVGGFVCDSIEKSSLHEGVKYVE